MGVGDVLTCHDFMEFKRENDITSANEAFRVEEWRGQVWVGVILGGGRFWWTQWQGDFNKILAEETRNIGADTRLLDRLTSWIEWNAPDGGLCLTFENQPLRCICARAPNGALMWLP